MKEIVISGMNDVIQEKFPMAMIQKVRKK